jgi:ketosteroid isomerase-like protein
MPSFEDKLQQLADRAEICELLTSYFSGLDSLDHEAVLNVFADEACLAISGEHVATGRQEIQAFFADQHSSTPGSGASGRETRISHHLMGVPSIVVDGDTAATETYALVHLAKGDPADGGEVIVRAIRYIDKLRRTVEGWRIVDRLHVADLGMSVPALFATTFNERRTARRSDLRF